MTPFPDGSGVTRGTLGPQDTAAWAVASAYRRLFSSACERASRRRHAAQCPPYGRQLGPTAGVALGIPGMPATAQFSTTLPTFLIAGCRQLGSPPKTAADFSAERLRGRRSPRG